ncbi:MAG: Tryptophan--tRNA ligase, mitochondrial [Caeruleum heppii]|nr:MAG: Tryptophan--tRNA ligase, mitochondrial [Caeruleum heppii]
MSRQIARIDVTALRRSTLFRSDPRRTNSGLTRCAQYSTPASPRQVVFSGIQPTGVPHLGNYLGALRGWVKMQNEAAASSKLLYSVVDLHALTVRQDPDRLRRWRRETMAMLIAIGLDPERSIIFHQSAVPAHAELMWILSCNASMGYLSRMTQWKSKLSLPQDAQPSDTEAKAKLKLGLLSYPVLQAADILVHRATHVPVGEDQTQQLEFARECATNFNHAHGQHLPLPTTIFSPAKRIMSLRRPHLKMSKSHEDPNSKILITDSREEIHHKIRQAITDSTEQVTYDPVNRPGVSNLIEIVHHLNSEGKTCEALADEFASLPLRKFKETVADCIVSGLDGIKTEYDRVMSQDGGRYLDDVARHGARKANESAAATMIVIREAIGL